MSDLVVRRLLVDLKQPIPVRWCGGDAFKSAFFNALSLSFPLGEKYFIDSLRAGVGSLPPEKSAAMAGELKGFIGQEATHRRVHSLLNDQLICHGLDNEIERRAGARMRANAGRDVRIHVAATAATEHFTAIFASWTLARPEVFDGSPDALRALWQWHAAEESEHRSVAFDIYQALGGSRRWRLAVFRYVTFTFLHDIGRQTLVNLRQDKALWQLSTWKSCWRLLFAKGGLLREVFGPWRAYLARDFHPSQIPEPLASKWLDENQALWEAVGAAKSA